MNPAIDRTIAVDRLAFDDRAYILSSKDSPGGRGINAACVIHSFGGETVAILPVGGERGTRLCGEVADYGFPVATVPIQNNIRLNFTVTDRHGLTVKLNETGPRLGKAEIESIELLVDEHLSRAKWLLLCGSLPEGVPADFYAKLIGRAKRRGVKTLLDTDGDALARGVEAGPTVVTPNQQEAERLLNTVLLTRSHAVTAARRVLSMGAEAVALSLGSRGAMGAWRDAAGAEQMVEAMPPRVEAISPIGAGDAMAAAVAWSMARGEEFAVALGWGVAAGTASAKLPGMKFATLEQTTAIHEDVDLRHVEL
jgi:1-phosphofructokinase family hexose kinase